MRESNPVSSLVRPAQPRQTVQVRFPDGALYEAPIGTPLEAFIQAGYAGPVPIMAGIVNGKLRELNFSLEHDAEVMPLSMATSDGMRIYQRSLTFLLIVAARELFPEATLIVDHSLPQGGFFCEVEGRPLFDADELARIEARMREIIEADEPITRQDMPIAAAIPLFERQGYLDKVRLLRSRPGESIIPVYTLRGVHDYFYGYMVPSTRYLRAFALLPASGGFILAFPTRDRPTELPQYGKTCNLTRIFREHLEWMDIMGVHDVASLNETIASGRIREVILVAEALHERRIAEIAAKIVAAHAREGIWLVLIAGPSSAGKSTFVKRLAVHLLALGVRPVSLGLDDYFVDRERTPRDEHGQYDFEALEVVDLELFNQQLLQLHRGQEVVLPRFNFPAGRREPGRSLSIPPDHIILVEGIHGLNPRLVPNIPPKEIYRVYVSALTQLNIDAHNRVPTTDTRLIRRIVRDASCRGYSALETIARWESVTRGERRNIFPYQDNADEIFNSALLYEMAVLKPFVEPLLRQIEPETSMEYIEAHRLLSFLSWFVPCEASLVPENSLLREFIGGSSLAEFSY